MEPAVVVNSRHLIHFDAKPEDLSASYSIGGIEQKFSREVINSTNQHHRIRLALQFVSNSE